ncbi:MAG TPA: hypothetical protein VL422_05695, partial [Miltoncostaea sp.]|nr:hypothetical protein [Miltoncostaea sp.]
MSRDPIHRPARRRPPRRLRLIGLAAGIVLAALVIAVEVVANRSGGGAPAPAARAAGTTTTTAPPPPSRPAALRATPEGSLGAPVQDAAAAAAGRGIVMAGGLTAADVSRADVLDVRGAHARAAGRLPVALHDAAAVAIGGQVYVAGGGDGVRQLDGIERIDPATGAVSTAGTLPRPSSDQAATAVGGTAYVVGGYDGSRWLDTFVAWRPGTPATVVAHLPTPLRYAAVTAAGDRVVIAGGSTPDGQASALVRVFDPRTGVVRTVGRLPAPTTHAAAAAIGGVAYVIGGRGAAVGTPSARVSAVDVARGRVTPAGRLPAPVSDAAAVAVPGAVLVLGGRAAGGTVATITSLRPATSVPAVPIATTAAAAPVDVYAHDGAGDLSPVVRGDLERVYVPDSRSDTVEEIDPRTYRVVRRFAVGALPQHVVPSWDLRTLWVTNDEGNSLTPIDPATGSPGRPVAVDDPYNMYFTPDGASAIVVAERNARLDFRDPHSMRLQESVPVPCRGVDHMDFSADGSFALASCEFSGQLVKVDLAQRRVTDTVTLPGGAMPQDVKLAPDGRLFYVADMMAGGLWEIDAASLRNVGFLPTGAGAHGLYPSRDGRDLYVSNRQAGTVSVVAFATRRVVRTWTIPGGGSPDMGGVSADGRVLWLSGRYDAEVSAISTVTGRLLARIPVGQGPHGLAVWP